MRLNKLRKRQKIHPALLAAIAATRAILGVGAGLLIARRIPRERRRKIGWALVGIGAASTVPLAAQVVKR